MDIKEVGSLATGKIVYVIANDKKKRIGFTNVCPKCGRPGVIIKNGGISKKCNICGTRLCNVLVVYNYYVQQYSLEEETVDIGTLKCPVQHNIWVGQKTQDGIIQSKDAARFFLLDDRNQNGDTAPLNGVHIEDYACSAFYDKREAEKFVSRLHEFQKKQVNDYNGKNGSSYVYPFD